ncbi:MAG: ferredoxin [Bacilli bacterium]
MRGDNMKINIIKDACIGCGACQAIVPEVFELNDEGIVEKKVTKLSEDMKNDVLDAVESCPTGAIEIDDEEE